ncbi:MAG: MlaD family protein [Magnetospirillum sp.]
MITRPAAVGGFILGGVALGVAAILFFGGLRLFSSTSRAVVFFGESLAGLEVGAPVTFQGVRIGSVQSIAIRMNVDEMTARIPVFLEFDSDKVSWEGVRNGGDVVDQKRLVAVGLRAQLAMQSLVTGQLRIDLEFRPGTPAQLVGAVTDVPEIPAVPSDLNELRNKLTALPLHELAETAQRAFLSLERLSGHLDSVLDPLSESVRRSTDAATRTLETTDETLRRLQMDVSTTLRGVDALVIDARAQLDSHSGDLGRTLVSAERASRQAEVLLESLNGLVEPRSQARGDLEATLRDLAASASSLRGFTRAVERDPSAILTGSGTP